MNEPRNDDERLSALIEGRVGGRQRDALLAHLSAADDDYAVFTDTAAVLQALEDEDAPGGRVVALFPRPWVRGAALAAAAAGIVLVSSLALRDRAPAGAQPVQLAALVDPAGQGLPQEWAGRSRWYSARGGSPADAGDVEAVRAGALMADLAVAVQGRDAADTRLLAEQVRNRWEPGAGGETPLRQIAARAGAPPESLNGLLQEATDRLAGRLGSEALQVGAWTEAALLAAHGRNEAFFREGTTRAMLARAERLAGDDAARAALARVRAALPEEGAPRWESLEKELDTLLRELAS
ncbi:MAG TPA: hypothetical protein VHG08_00455 [Longimicrobium sp.]|nr:hypothetical protein [Longimicrobium sp.]